MKKILTMLAIGMVAAFVQADVIMDATTLNGDFEDGWGTGARDFADAGEVYSWWNAGSGNQTATAANTTLSAAPASGYNAVSSDNGLGGAVVHSAKTDYTIQSGDYFDVSFDWLDAFGWEANDQARVALVAFDNNALSGSEVMRITISDKVTTASTWESVSETTAVVDAGAEGKTLFVQLYGINGGAGTGDFFRADNIVVEVIPEPATVGMLGLGAFATLIVRRFKRA